MGKFHWKIDNTLWYIIENETHLEAIFSILNILRSIKNESEKKRESEKARKTKIILHYISQKATNDSLTHSPIHWTEEETLSHSPLIVQLIITKNSDTFQLLTFYYDMKSVHYALSDAPY